ncbi:yippee-like protein [Tanacetum coccineum]
MLPRVPLSYQASACSVSTLHFLKFSENSLEVLKLLENSLEVLKLMENKLESMKILENKLESLKLQENQPVDGLLRVHWSESTAEPSPHRAESTVKSALI